MKPRPLCRIALPSSPFRAPARARPGPRRVANKGLRVYGLGIGEYWFGFREVSIAFIVVCVGFELSFVRCGRCFHAGFIGFMAQDLGEIICDLGLKGDCKPY